jgi:predicted transposase YdaD
MPKPYDAATKDLIRWRPADFLALAGLPVPADPAGVVMLDAELSIMTRAADKLIRVDGADGGPYLAVVEFQSGYDDRLDDRVHLYSAMARWNYNLPVRSVVYLLSRAAQSRGSTGRVDGPGLRFAYDVIPVWSLPVSDLLDGPIGTVPLAPLVDQPLETLAITVDQVWQRLKADVGSDRLNDVMTQTAVLIGLRYDETIAERLMQSVLEMEDSSVYQAIIRKGIDRGIALGREEGREEGREQGARAVLLRQATGRFGPPTDAARARLNAAGPAELDRLADRVLSATGWDDLLAD